MQEKFFFHQGDTLILKKGDCVNADIPSKFYFSGINSFFDEKPYHTGIIIGDVFKRKTFTPDDFATYIYEHAGSILYVSKEEFLKFINGLQLDFSQQSFDTSVLTGEYTVTQAYMDHDCTDSAYSRWHVFATNKSNNLKVDFYQSGMHEVSIQKDE